MTYDVIVVGGGVAGLTAAVRAAEGGARVLVLAKGVGSTHLAPATIDVLGYADGRRVDRPLEQLGDFVAARPGHPYARVPAEEITAALEWLRGRVDAGSLAGYGYVGSANENLLLPTALGALKPSALAPAPIAAGDLRDGGRVALVTITQLRDFFPALAAAALGRADGVEARPIELPLPAGARNDLNALGLAERFEDPEFRNLVVTTLAPRLHADERVGFPAALGVNDPHGVWSDLQERLGRRVFEIPTLPPSVPGIRLFRILREALRRAGGRLVIGPEVTGADHDAGRVQAVRAHVAARERTYGADWVVLATGGFASGGLDMDSRWRAHEPVLGLPVAGVPEPGAPRFKPRYFDEHPMSPAGIATDAHLRPVDGAGNPLYENVLVAGAALAGATPWREQSGEGISITTGYRAAGQILGQSAPARQAGPQTTVSTES
jgi:glycerol-3-phosphate dehydrogenase subunit B